MSAATRRELKEIEASLEAAETEYQSVSDRLRLVQQERANTEEELRSQNSRLKAMLDEIATRKVREGAADAAGKSEEQAETRMTMAELNRRVEGVLMEVLTAKLRDESFATALIEKSSTSTGDKVRVEFDQDEVFWQLQENYTFENLLEDAARYWDISPQDCVLYDERGAIWPSDAYVSMELREHPSARVTLKIKAVAAAQSTDEVEVYGREGEVVDSESSDDEEAMKDLMQLAESAEDEILKAKARGGKANLNNKQKLALKKKLKRELMYFVLFVTLFIYVLYARRTVIDAFYMQQAISTAFVDEAFGDYNEKTFDDIATAGEMFDWMDGPLKEGLFPEEMYNGQPVPDDRLGYVMGYNKVVGKVRLRQLRVKPGGCDLPESIKQSDYTEDGQYRQRQFVDYCFPAYPAEGAADERMVSRDPFGPPELQGPAGRDPYAVVDPECIAPDCVDPNVVPADVELTGFFWTDEVFNKLEGTQVGGSVASYDGSGFVRDLDSKNRTEYLQVTGRHCQHRHHQSRHLHLTSTSHPSADLVSADGVLVGRPPDARRHRLAQPVQRQLRLLLPVDLHARVLAGRHGGTKSDAQAAEYGHLHRGLLPGVEPGEVGARDVRVLRRAAVHHGLPLPNVPHQARDEDVQAALQRLLEHLGHDALLGTTSGRVSDIRGAPHTHLAAPTPLSHPALLPPCSSPRSR